MSIKTLSHREAVLEKMQRISEKSLRERVLLPLLEKYEFTHIEKRHGPHEKGVDILCLRSDEFGDTEVLVVQAKRFKFSGAASNKGHLHGLLNQLSQCLKEPIKLADGTCRPANRVWFISPYPLNIDALESSFAAIADANVNRIKVIDGPKLVAVLQSKAPELLVQFGDKSASYLKRVKTEMILIQESTALRLPEKLSVLPIYVQLDFSVLAGRVSEVLSARSGLGSDLAGITAILRSKLAQFQHANAVDDRASALVDLQSHANWLTEELSRKETSASFEETRRSFLPDTHRYRLQIDSETILQSRLNFQVVGPAGAGKTTLLRILAYTEARHRTPRIPILISLAALGKKRSIFEQIQYYCRTQGLPSSKQSVSNLLTAGGALVLLDGVDEVLSTSENVRNELLSFIKQFRSVQCIFTARSWATLPPGPLFCTAALLPFTHEQVNEFCHKWFRDNPADAVEIIEHLKKNSHLYEVISTPLVATVLAVVKRLGGSLPSSLNELYEERLRLLLHDWDAVKEVRRDFFSPKDKLFFLRKLAFKMHSERVRALRWQEIVQYVQATIGQVHSRAEAELFALELVNHNNLLCEESRDTWGFGHLRFQEHLTAMEASQNEGVSLADFIGDGWWNEVLAIYADIKRDISPIISKIYKKQGGEGLSDRPELLLKLMDLLKLAPNTDRAEQYRVEKDWEIYTSVEKSFRTISDDSIRRGKSKPHVPRSVNK